jgi:hypothetical protein
MTVRRKRSNGMELVAHRRLSKQALIDLAFFCGVPFVLAMLSAVLGPYVAIMEAPARPSMSSRSLLCPDAWPASSPNG